MMGVVNGCKSAWHEDLGVVIVFRGRTYSDDMEMRVVVEKGPWPYRDPTLQIHRLEVVSL